MNLHDLLSLTGILVEIVAIVLTVLEISGHRVSDVIGRGEKGTDGRRQIRKRPVSARRKLLLSAVLLALLASALTWSIAREALWTVVAEYRVPLLWGLGYTIGVSSLAIVLGTLLGAAVAWLMTKETRSIWVTTLKAVTESSVYLLLALPVLIEIYIAYYGWHTSIWVVMTAALAINLSPFIAKIIVGSLNSISREQIAAAEAFGYSDFQIFRYFKVKYVIGTSIQSFLVEYYTTIKLSSLTSVVGFAETLHVSQDIVREKQDPVTAYAVLALCYIIVVAPLALTADYMERTRGVQRHEQ